MAEAHVTVSDVVRDRKGGPRWGVVATFVGVGGSEPRCVDYRVRVIPEIAEEEDEFAVISPVMEKLVGHSPTESDVAALGTIPPEGIPRYVFELASQAKLLEAARQWTERNPAFLREQVDALLSRQRKPQRGRPPTRTLRERLQILADVESTWAAGGTLNDVAEKHHMSRSAVRDLLEWARSGDAGVQLFEGTTQGRRSGGLTAAGRELLEKTAQED